MAKKKNRWEIPNRIMEEYQRALRGLEKRIEATIGKDMTNPDEVIAALYKVMGTPAFKKFSEKASMKMVNNVYVHGRGRWRTTVLESPQGYKIYEAIQKELRSSPVGSAYRAKIKENAKLISTAPRETAEKLTNRVQEYTQQGLRSEEITARLKAEYPELLESRLKLIARTEVSKTQTALTQARAVNLGLDWYIWRTSRDSRVRHSHDRMEGVLIRWSDPPSPEALSGKKSYGKYHAGDTYNDRCYPEPVVDFDYISFPCEVYHNGKITTMTRAQFEKIAV